MPAWAAVLASVVLLDLAIYGQHIVFHAVPALWRLHRMHCLEFDVTTGIRFHPIEIALSMVIKFAVVVALDAPASAVLIFEVLLNATSMFNHGNVRLPDWADRILRWLVVTPEMHRVHHSILCQETLSASTSSAILGNCGSTACCCNLLERHETSSRLVDAAGGHPGSPASRSLRGCSDEPATSRLCRLGYCACDQQECTYRAAGDDREQRGGTACEAKHQQHDAEENRRKPGPRTEAVMGGQYRTSLRHGAPVAPAPSGS
jgi:hypothetical protein